MITVDIPGVFDAWFQGTGVAQGEEPDRPLYLAHKAAKQIKRGRGYVVRLVLPDAEAQEVLGDLKWHAGILAESNPTGAESKAVKTLLERIDKAGQEGAQVDNGATSHVMRNLMKPVHHDDGGLRSLTAGEMFPTDTVENFRAAAMAWLGDKSDLATKTIENADYQVAYDWWKSREPEPEPEPEALKAEGIPGADLEPGVIFRDGDNWLKVKTVGRPITRHKRAEFDGPIVRLTAASRTGQVSRVVVLARKEYRTASKFPATRKPRNNGEQ